MERLSVPQSMGQMSTLYNSGRMCADCSEEFTLGEAVALLQVVIPQVDEGRVVFRDFENPDGSYAYEPFLFHERCWKESYERLAEELEEQCCEAVIDNRAFGKCTACNSGLLVGEPLGLLQYGMLVTSRRQPNGEHGVVFEEGSGRVLLCLSCLRTINEDIIEMWDSISYAGECAMCTYERRWRTGHVCDHEEDEEEDGNT